MSKTLHLWFGIIFTASAPVLVGLIFQDFNVAWLSALCGAAIILTAKVDALAELSLGPLKAKMQATIGEATATLAQLRETATTIVKVVLSDMVTVQFVSGMSQVRRFELHDELIADLKKLGASREQLDRAQVEWWRGVGYLYHHQLSLLLHRVHATEKREELDKLVGTGSSAVPPDAYEEFFKKYNLLSPDIHAAIDDYRHFLATREVRRPNEFDSAAP